jgi:hypothetical protein
MKKSAIQENSTNSGSVAEVDTEAESAPASLAGKLVRPVSLRDVAKWAKVSVATVSMVLNDNPRISRATHLRVQKVIDQAGYRPNRLAQSLSSRYTRVLAVLLPALRHGFGDAYFGELISGICDKAGKIGYKVMLEQAKPEFIKAREHIEIFELMEFFAWGATIGITFCRSLSIGGIRWSSWTITLSSGIWITLFATIGLVLSR